MDTTAPTPVPPLGLVEKSRLLLASAIAVVLLVAVGWVVAQPQDPQLGVLLVSKWGHMVGSWPALIVITAVAAAIGTVLAPRRLAEGGVFVAAIGLVGLALKGGSMQDVLSYMGTTEASGRRWLMTQLAIDSLLWTVVLLAAWMTVVIVRRWLWSDEELYSPVALPRPAGGLDPTAARKPAQIGWPAMVVTGLVAVFFIWLTDARTSVASVARGQIIGSVAGGFFIGAMAARWCFPGINQSHWYLLAVPAAALLAYLLGYLSADMSWAGRDFKALATTPPHALARPLPIEYLAVGVTATLLGYWSGEKIEHVVEEKAV